MSVTAAQKNGADVDIKGHSSIQGKSRTVTQIKTNTNKENFIGLVGHGRARFDWMCVLLS